MQQIRFYHQKRIYTIQSYFFYAEFGKFIVQLINLFWESLICCTVCDKGQAIIKKRLGYPIKWRTKAGLYWKIPFIDVFDKVDIRKKYSQFNAHSFYESQNVNGVLIPYNILVDFQAEYQIVNPLGIYEANGLRDGEDIVISFISKKKDWNCHILMWILFLNNYLKNYKKRNIQTIRRKNLMMISENAKEL